MKDILPELNGKDYIEKLNDDYDIRFCQIDEFDELIEFIDTYWRKNHIFVLSKPMFDFQHLNLEDNRYDFIIAKHRKTGEIHSALGFVTSNHFDRNIKPMMVWPAIWKTRDDIKVKGLGVGLFYYMKEHLQIDNISALGISTIALSIYKHWNFETGRIIHYVYPNQHISEYYLSENMDKFEKRPESKDDLMLKECDEQTYRNISENDEVFSDLSMYKSKEYYINRFFKHPIYHYRFYTIGSNDEIKAVVIARESGSEGHNCLRIVDYIGKLSYLKSVNQQLDELMDSKKYEYIDFVIAGADEDELRKCNFINKYAVEDIVVPNYFEPFVKQNIDLDYALRSIHDDKAVFFKADSDQDRPNLLP